MTVRASRLRPCLPIACALAVASGCQQPVAPETAVAPTVAAVAAGQRPAATPAQPDLSAPLPGRPAAPGAPAAPTPVTRLPAGSAGGNGVATSTAAGAVSLFGQPVANASVQLYRAGGAAPLGHGQTNASGHFDVTFRDSVGPGTPLRVVATTSAGQALASLGVTSVVAAGGGNYRLAAAKGRTPVNQGTTVAMAMNPTLERLMADAPSESGTGTLLTALDDLAGAADAALQVLQAPTGSLDPKAAADALGEVFALFSSPASAPASGLPASLAGTLIQGSQIAAGTPGNTGQSPLESAFSQSVRTVTTVVQTAGNAQGGITLSLPAVTFGNQTQPPVAMTKGRPPVSIGVSLTPQHGGFLPASAPPTIALPGPQ